VRVHYARARVYLFFNLLMFLIYFCDFIRLYEPSLVDEVSSSANDG